MGPQRSKQEVSTDAATPDGVGYEGEPWNETMREITWELAELAKAGWTSPALTVESARALVRIDAPRDAGHTVEVSLDLFDRALSKVSPRARGERLDSGLTEAAPSADRAMAAAPRGMRLRLRGYAAVLAGADYALTARAWWARGFVG